ncbi:shikimate dehydrogenase [Piscibacillus salipiscarius]|uniref:shikimate dehydrogenase n=1 Tax=Piscibacillus salipiscarius TaxID=299480 RepID=UPI0006D0DBBD|nr:shikimate dehydrogenase [Piscibacillus salipiscarius]
MYRLGLIGHPVNHSNSPDIHHFFLKQTNNNGTYRLFDLQAEELEEFLKNMRHSDLNGINVTVPYKERVIPFLDDLDEHAQKLNAVNTIKRKGNRLIGYNTDGEGYIESLNQTYPNFYNQINNQSILILGAGGAAKGIFYSLKSHAPKQLDVANRTISKASKMTNHYEHSQEMDLEYAEKQLDQYDLIIQTTNVGMEPNENELIISPKL